jgi:hypothetical protein
MKQLLNNVDLKFERIGLILKPLIIFNVIIYISGSFIAWDTNPMNWLLIRTILGRISLIVLELYIFIKIPKFWGGWDRHR